LKEGIVVLHIRQGHGNFAIYPGQTIPRELPLSYFDALLDSILQLCGKSAYSLLIFTDAPKQNVSFIPPIEQESLWHGMPGYDGKNLVHRGKDLEGYFENKYSDSFTSIIVDRESNPLIMLERMTRACYLGVSRSSLSYISGILNSNGMVFYPPQFWHPRPKEWKLINDHTDSSNSKR
jgi:hypothetical protein